MRHFSFIHVSRLLASCFSEFGNTCILAHHQMSTKAFESLLVYKSINKSYFVDSLEKYMWVWALSFLFMKTGMVLREFAADDGRRAVLKNFCLAAVGDIAHAVKRGFRRIDIGAETMKTLMEQAKQMKVLAAKGIIPKRFSKTELL